MTHSDTEELSYRVVDSRPIVHITGSFEQDIALCGMARPDEQVLRYIFGSERVCALCTSVEKALKRVLSRETKLDAEQKRLMVNIKKRMDEIHER